MQSSAPSSRERNNSKTLAARSHFMIEDIRMSIRGNEVLTQVESLDITSPRPGVVKIRENAGHQRSSLKNALSSIVKGPIKKYTITFF